MFRPWEDPQPSTSREYPEDEVDNFIAVPNENKKTCQNLCQRAQEIVNNVYKNIKASEGEKGAIEKTAHLTEVSTSTVYRIIKNGVKPRKIRSDKGTSKDLDPPKAKLLRDIIYDKYKKNEIPTVESLHIELNRDGILSVSETTLWRWLLKVGFKFKGINKRAKIMECRRIVLYCIVLKKNRSAVLSLVSK